jgi:hypothetical protein
MSVPVRVLLILAVVISIAAIIVWAITGFHFYTKYEVVEQIEVPVDPDDPFAGTGFFENETETKVVSRAEFHLGLLPTPQGLLDRHLLSVLTLVVPVWLAAALFFWLHRRKVRRRSP